MTETLRVCQRKARSLLVEEQSQKPPAPSSQAEKVDRSMYNDFKSLQRFIHPNHDGLFVYAPDVWGMILRHEAAKEEQSLDVKDGGVEDKNMKKYTIEMPDEITPDTFMAKMSDRDVALGITALSHAVPVKDGGEAGCIKHFCEDCSFNHSAHSCDMGCKHQPNIPSNTNPCKFKYRFSTPAPVASGLVEELQGLVKRLTPVTDDFSSMKDEWKQEAVSEVADCITAILSRHATNPGKGDGK